MKPPLAIFVLCSVAWFSAGCESTGVSARIREKPAAYAALPADQQALIREGGIAIGFSPEMVRLALGQPSLVQTEDSPQGPVTTMIYKRFYITEGIRKTWAAGDHDSLVFLMTGKSGEATATDAGGGGAALAGVNYPGYRKEGPVQSAPGYIMEVSWPATLYVIMSQDRLARIKLDT